MPKPTRTNYDEVFTQRGADLLANMGEELEEFLNEIARRHPTLNGRRETLWALADATAMLNAKRLDEAAEELSSKLRDLQAQLENANAS